MNNGLAAAVSRDGGTAFTPPRPGAGTPCGSFDEVIAGLRSQLTDRRNQTTFVLLDSEALTRLADTQANVMSGLGLSLMNLRLFTRPLHIFENVSGAARNPEQPNVGVYADQEITPLALRVLLQKVLGKPAAVVPFQNVAEMARCLAVSSQYSTGRSQCPAEIQWAVIVEQDASLVVDAFRTAYKSAAKAEPADFVTNMQLGVELGASRSLQPGIDLIVSPSQAVPALPVSAAPTARRAPTLSVPRSQGQELAQQEARQSTKPPSRLSSLWAWFGSFGLLSAAANESASLLRHPYPIILTNQDPPDERLRESLSDSYLRVLSFLSESAMGTPCTAVAERIHRAYLFNAHLDDPTSDPKTLGLASELVTATGDARNFKDLFARLNLSSDPSEWKKELGPPPTSKEECPAIPNERFPDDRYFFSNPNLIFQYRAIEHLRQGNLDGAAVCLRRAVALRAVPDCHVPERSTYSFYYNPYFYFAVQQVDRARPAR